MRLADALVEVLLEYGTSEAFGVTGRGSLYLTDAFARSENFNFTPLLHEQSAGYAALGYTSVSGKPSVCAVSTGVGSTNALTPLICAWQDQLPVIFLSGQNFSEFSTSLNPTGKRTHGEQELDLSPMVRSATKSFYLVDTPNNFEDSFRRALDSMFDGRPGPVWIDVPLDFQSAKVSLSPNRNPMRTYNPQELKKVEFPSSQLLEKANRPALLIGPSMRLDPSFGKLATLVERLGIPVFFESGAEDLFPTFHPNSIGAVGQMAGDPRAVACLENADLVIALGSLLRTSLTGTRIVDFLPNAQFVIFDYDDNEVPEALSNRATFAGKDFSSFLDSVIAQNKRYSSWLDACLVAKTIPHSALQIAGDSSGIDLHTLGSLLSHVSDAHTIFVSDSGFCEVILPSNTPLSENQRWLHPFSQGAMGFGTGAAIGAAGAFPDAKIVLVVGDGSLMMNVQDLQTISSKKLNISVVVVDNDMYGIIRFRQENLFRGRFIGVDEETGVSAPDWEQLAKSMNLCFTDILDSNHLDSRLGEALSIKGPNIVRLKGNPTQRYWEWVSAPMKKNQGEMASRATTIIEDRENQLEAAREALSAFAVGHGGAAK